MTQNETNRDKHITEASKQSFANNLFKISYNARKVCFPIGRFVSMSSIQRTCNNFLCNLSKIMKLYKKTSCANLPIRCQQTTKTASKCNTDSFLPVRQFWSVTLKCKRDSKPQSCVQQHKSLKVTRNTTNPDKHINEASKQAFANNLFKMSCKYTLGMLSNRRICCNVFHTRCYDDFLCTLSKITKTV